MISIILPYLRDDGYRRCVDAVKKTAFGVPFEIVAEKDTKKIGCPKMVNKLIGRSKFDLICFLHDDSIPQDGFLYEAYRAMQTFDGNWGCVGFNDLFHGEDGPPTHWMIHKNMLQYFPDGVFYSEDYIHTRVDQELKDVSQSVGRYVWAEKAKIKHMNPIHTSERRSRTHKKCYSKAAQKHDAGVYERRKQ